MARGIQINKMKIKRATIIVDTKDGILISSHSRGKHPTYMLPGGSIKKGERPISAAIRELYEETGLIPTKIKHLFDYYHHKVYLAKTHGKPKKHHEITHIRHWHKNTRRKLSWHVEPIIGIYKMMKI